MNHLIKRGVFLFPLFLYSNELIFHTPFSSQFIKFENISYSDFTSIYDLANNWKKLKNKSKNNILYYDTVFEINKKMDNYSIGYLREDKYFINSNKDTVLFIYQLVNKKELIENKKYNIDLDLKGIGFDSIFISKTVSKDCFEVGIIISILKMRDFQDGWIKGDVISYSDDNYEYHGVSDYYYNHNYLYHLDIKKAKGYGYTTHLGIKYKKDNLKFLYLINDVFSKVYIKNAPYSHVYLNSSNKTYKNGYVKYNPSISGVEKYINYIMVFDKKSKVEFKYTKYFIGDDYFKNCHFPYVGYINNKYKISYGFRFKDIQLEYKLKKFIFKLGANELNLKESSYIKVGINYRYKF